MRDQYLNSRGRDEIELELTVKSFCQTSGISSNEALMRVSEPSVLNLPSLIAFAMVSRPFGQEGMKSETMKPLIFKISTTLDQCSARSTISEEARRTRMRMLITLK